MLAKYIFNIDMALGYLAWALCIATYVWPRLRTMDQVEAHRLLLRPGRAPARSADAPRSLAATE